MEQTSQQALTIYGLKEGKRVKNPRKSDKTFFF